MTRTLPHTFDYTCTHCGFEYSKPLTKIVPEGQECEILFCGQCKGMEAVRIGEKWSTIFKIEQKGVRA